MAKPTTRDDRKPVLGCPKFRLSNPDVTLTADQFELLSITYEDLRYLGIMEREDLIDNPPAIRAASTTLRRLLCDGGGDLRKAARVAGWQEPFLVTTRLLDYDRPHPQIIVSCGGGRWGRDRMPDCATYFGGENTPEPPQEWTWRENVSVKLSDYLDSLAFAITGTKVKRHEVVTYVANKKAAHVADGRRRPAHEVLDHMWYGLYLHRVDPDGDVETLNAVYLELLSILVAIVESPSIQRFSEWLIARLNTYQREYGPEVARRYDLQFPFTPLDDD